MMPVMLPPPRLIYTVLLGIFLVALSSAVDVSRICTHAPLPLPAAFAFLPPRGAGSAFLTSSIDLLDVLPLSKVHHLLHWRVLVDGSSSALAQLLHEQNAEGGDAASLRLLLHDSAPLHSHLRIVPSLSKEPLQQTGCADELEHLAAAACVVDVRLVGAGRGGAVHAVMTQPFTAPPLALRTAAVVPAAPGIHFISPVGGSTFSSSMPLLILLHLETVAANAATRWVLQVRCCCCCCWCCCFYCSYHCFTRHNHNNPTIAIAE